MRRAVLGRRCCTSGMTPALLSCNEIGGRSLNESRLRVRRRPQNGDEKEWASAYCESYAAADGAIEMFQLAQTKRVGACVGLYFETRLVPTDVEDHAEATGCAG